VGALLRAGFTLSVPEAMPPSGLRATGNLEKTRSREAAADRVAHLESMVVLPRHRAPPLGGRVKTEHSHELARRDTEYWWFRSRYRLVHRLLSDVRAVPLPNGLLDFGCGAGGFLKFAEASGLCGRDRMIGLDADSGSIDLVRKAGFQAMVADAGALSGIHLRTAPSAISMLDVLEHLPDPVEALVQLRRIGKPGTVLVCLVPALQGLWSEWDERLGHQRRYTTRTLRGHLTMAGWKPVSLQYMFPSMVLPALARRWAGVTGGADEFPAVPKWIDRALGGWTAMENGFRHWPFGTSVAALAIA